MADNKELYINYSQTQNPTKEVSDHLPIPSLPIEELGNPKMAEQFQQFNRHKRLDSKRSVDQAELSIIEELVINKAQLTE